MQCLRLLWSAGLDINSRSTRVKSKTAFNEDNSQWILLLDEIKNLGHIIVGPHISFILIFLNLPSINLTHCPSVDTKVPNSPILPQITNAQWKLNKIARTSPERTDD